MPRPRREADERPPTPPVLMTESQRLIQQLVNNAEADAPIIESVTDLAPEDRLAVPKEFKKHYPERRFKWLDINRAGQQSPTSGGIWVVANRSNCSKIPKKVWHVDGAVLFPGGQNILAFTRRTIGDLIEKQIIDGFRTNRTLNSDMRQDFKDSTGKMVGHMERVSSSEIEGDYGHTDLTSELRIPSTGEVLPADTVDFEA